MIAVDTNVLLRLLLVDDDAMHASAKKAVSALIAERKLFIPSIVVVEVVWMLTNRKWPRTRIAQAIEALLMLDGATIPQRAVFERALAYFRAGKQGFSDYVILAESECAGAARLLTFDLPLCREHSACLSPKALIG